MPQPMEPIDTKDLKCVNCGRKGSEHQVLSWAGDADRGGIDVLVCPTAIFHPMATMKKRPRGEALHD